MTKPATAKDVDGAQMIRTVAPDIYTVDMAVVDDLEAETASWVEFYTERNNTHVVDGYGDTSWGGVNYMDNGAAIYMVSNGAEFNAHRPDLARLGVGL